MHNTPAKRLKARAIAVAVVVLAQFALGLSPVTLGPVSVAPAANASTNAFACDSSFYQVSGGLFYKYSAQSGNYERLGTANVPGINAMGFNPADNYLYGSTGSFNLHKIDNTGAMTSIGTFNGSGQIYGADFIDDDVMIYVGNTMNRLELVRAGGPGTPVTSSSAQAITLTHQNPGVGSAFSGGGDITIFKDYSGTGYKGYLLQANVLYVFSFASANATSATYLTKLVSFPGSVAPFANGTWGAQYSDASGNLFFYNNNVYSGSLHHIVQLSGAERAAITTTSANPTVSIAASTTIFGSGNDGASCPNAPSAFAPSVTTTSGATSVSTGSATVAGTVTPNTSTSAAIAAAQLCYSTTSTVNASGLNTGQLAGATCVASNPATLAASNTPSAIEATLSGLNPGTTYYFQAKATNAGGLVGFGAVSSFATGVPIPAAPYLSIPAQEAVGTAPASLSPAVSAPGGIALRCLVDPADSVCKTKVSIAEKGAFTLEADGSVNFTAVLGWSGSASVLYRVIDGYGQGSQVPASVTVTKPAPPTVEDVSVTTVNTVPAVLVPSVNGVGTSCLIDPAGSGCRSEVALAGKGKLVLGKDGVVTFEAVSGFLGLVAAELQVTDAYNQVAKAVLTVSVESNGSLQTGSTNGTAPVQLMPIQPLVSGAACLLDPADSVCKGSVTVSQVGDWRLNKANGSVVFEAKQGFSGTASIRQRADAAGYGLNDNVFVVTVAKKRKPVTITISGFKPGSPALTSAMKAQIDAFTKAHVGYRTVECTGFTMGPTVLKGDKWLSMARATGSCDFIKKTLKVRTKSLPPKNKMETLVGSDIRRITITLRD